MKQQKNSEGKPPLTRLLSITRIINIILVSVIFYSCQNKPRDSVAVSIENQFEVLHDSLNLESNITSINLENDLFVEIDFGSLEVNSETLAKEFILMEIGMLRVKDISQIDSLSVKCLNFPSHGKSIKILLSQSDCLKLIERCKDDNKYTSLLQYIYSNKFFLEFLALEHLMNTTYDDFKEFDGDFLELSRLFFSECANNETYNIKMFSLALTTCNSKTSKLLKIINYCYFQCGLKLITKENLETFFNDVMKESVSFKWNDYDSTKLF